MTSRIHIIEAGGRGGVFQHSIELTRILHESGAPVVLHTAADAEIMPPGLPLCGCIAWDRSSTSRRVRQVRTLARFSARALPHLAATVHRADIVHVQGLFALTSEIIAATRRATVVCSPHNTFVRGNGVGETRALRSVLTRSDRVLVYTRADTGAPGLRPGRFGVVPLVQWTPPVDPGLVEQWRKALGAGPGTLVVLAGQVRADKNPDLFVRAVTSMNGWRGAVVGEDLGAGRALSRLIDELGAPVTTHFDYLPMDRFVALVAAADVIAAPYRIASQSGVLAVAAKLGVPTAATPAGGLSELATAVASDDSPDALGAAIVAAHDLGARPRQLADVAETYLNEYELARSTRHDR